MEENRFTVTKDMAFQLEPYIKAELMSVSIESLYSDVFRKYFRNKEGLYSDVEVEVAQRIYNELQEHFEGVWHTDV